MPLGEKLIVTNEEGESVEYRDGKHYPAPPQYALCRCGQSGNKPFCDGTHKKVQFDGTETASRQSYAEQATAIEGPTMALAMPTPTMMTTGMIANVHRLVQP